MEAKLVPYTEMRCGFCNVRRERRSEQTVDMGPTIGDGLFRRSERDEYTCAVCEGRLIAYVGNLMVSEITGAVGWASKPDAVDAYEFSQRGFAALADAEREER